MDEDRPAPPSAGARRRTHSLVRVVALLALLAAAAGVLHAVAIDELLGHRRLVALACRHPERFLFGWEKAESPFPGRVRLVNVWFRARDQKDEWWFRIREATFTFSPFELPASRFHVTSLSGTGVSFWLRDRRTRGQESPGLAKALPPIPGFAPVPFEDEPALAPLPGGTKLWTVAIDRIALAEVADLWFDRTRFEGEARVTGRFVLTPHTRAAIGPASVEFASGRVTRDRAPVCDTLRGRVAADLKPFDPRDLDANRVPIWDVTSGTARLRATAANGTALAALLPKELDARLGRTALALRLSLERGGAASGAVALDAAGLALRAKDVEIAARASLRAAIARFDVKSHALRLGPTRLALHDATVRGPESASGWWATLEAGSARFEPGRGVDAPLRLASRDALPILGAVSPNSPRVLRKLLTMPGLVATARFRAGPRRLDVERLVAEGEGARVSGRYEKRDGVRQGALLLEKGKLAAALRFEEGAPKWKLLGARKWFERQGGAAELPAAGRTR